MAACCGIYNLDLAKGNSYEKLLKERSKKLETISLKNRQALLAYRHRQETIESKFKRQDPEVYVCPFLAYIEATCKRMGCMIHPQRTGQSDSQDISFYGASICKSYDCPNKEEDHKKSYALLLGSCFPKSHEYSRLMADRIFFLFLNFDLSKTHREIIF